MLGTMNNFNHPKTFYKLYVNIIKFLVKFVLIAFSIGIKIYTAFTAIILFIRNTYCTQCITHIIIL